ncbi:MAG: 2Fe-2S iron-sulfur cluster-binding protein [Thermoanaerobaculia bacterium]
MRPSDPSPCAGEFLFEGRRIPAFPGDTVASALFRAGVRVFSRSFKFQRPRGLYCLTGDCPNCLMAVDGEPAVRTCRVPANAARHVERAERAGPMRRLLLRFVGRRRERHTVSDGYRPPRGPVLWRRFGEWVARESAGIGTVRRDVTAPAVERQHHHPDLLIVGGGIAGLAAAAAAAERGERVLLVEEGGIGESFAPGAARDRLQALQANLRASPTAVLLERSVAIGIYPGPVVPVVGVHGLHVVHPQRIVVATGAVERHAIFPGNDLPGVWMGRGAARMAGVHGMAPGKRIVVAVSTGEGVETLLSLAARTRAESDCRIVAAIVPAELADRVPDGIERVVGGRIRAAFGRSALRGVVIEVDGTLRKRACDALVLALGWEPRDSLLRQADLEPVSGAGEVVQVGCSIAEAEASGIAASQVERALPGVAGGERPPISPSLPVSRGFVCLCEDARGTDLQSAWNDGMRFTELMKRYTKTTQGACQGALCHAPLRAFIQERTASPAATKKTIARPPARPVRLADLAAGVRTPPEAHTSLHTRHLALGATLEWAGVWKRPSHYGDARAEYRAVRESVSLMDVSTLGKYRIAGPDATEFLERLYPCRVADLAPWRSRYALLLNEAGSIFDDGLVGKLSEGEFYVTFTSSGADSAEAWMRDWAETWKLRVHIANRTAAMSAIHVAGPRTRDLLARLVEVPAAIDNSSLPFGGLREVEVAGVPCLAIRVGFVGELSVELHHPSGSSPALWDALTEAGKKFGLRPHGLDALKLLRLEKGHFIVGLDTDFDTTPAKVGADWAVRMEKPYFLGQAALARIARLPRERSLLKISFAGDRAPEEGAQLFAGESLSGAPASSHVGHLTSSRYSPTLGIGVALGWVRHPDGAVPEQVIARDTRGDLPGRVVRTAFYDPKGERLRA